MILIQKLKHEGWYTSLGPHPKAVHLFASRSHAMPLKAGTDV